MYLNGQTLKSVGSQPELIEGSRRTTYKSDHQYYSMSLRTLPHCSICGTSSINASPKECPFLLKSRQLLAQLKAKHTPFIPVPSKAIAVIFEISDHEDDFDVGLSSNAESEGAAPEDSSTFPFEGMYLLSSSITQISTPT